MYSMAQQRTMGIDCFDGRETQALPARLHYERGLQIALVVVCSRSGPRRPGMAIQPTGWLRSVVDITRDD